MDTLSINLNNQPNNGGNFATVTIPPSQRPNIPLRPPEVVNSPFRNLAWCWWQSLDSISCWVRENYRGWWMCWMLMVIYFYFFKSEFKQGTEENRICFQPRYAWYRKESDWMSLTGIWNKKVGSKHETRLQTKTYPQQCSEHTVFGEMLAVCTTFGFWGIPSSWWNWKLYA